MNTNWFTNDYKYFKLNLISCQPIGKNTWIITNPIKKVTIKPPLLYKSFEQKIIDCGKVPSINAGSN